MVSDAQIDFEAMRAACAAMRAQAAALRHRARALSGEIRDTHAGLAEVVETCRRTLGIVQAARAARLGSIASPTAASAMAPPNALLQALTAAGLDPEADLDDLTKTLIAAYRAAIARDDDEMRILLGYTLRSIGHQLATKVGPKAAGVILN